MRAGGGTVQQALTTEAANVVKQAVALARRRGHAQVTPLHVASTMLSSTTGVLRTACIQSHSHPLQCRALELCFNVALNRLPASTSSPMYGTHSQFPSISNALVAAFKRAQAHQRRGSIENQQQPLLAVKIELEQLIISILDDPSVSRVMREAGFSSTQVKSNVEQVVSLEICSQNAPSAPSSKSNKESNNTLALSQSSTQVEDKVVKPRGSEPIRNEDVMYVIENLRNKKRRSLVVVGECISSIEAVVRAVIDKVDEGDVPESLREVKFITLSFSSFGHLNRLEVEAKLEELKRLVRNCISTGVILNLGDLKWAIEYRASSSEQVRGYYCPVEHMIMELGKLVSSVGENGRFWIMGFATFQTFMRCKSGHPSMESVLGLHPLTIPADSLRLSLITDSDLQSQSTSKRGENGSSWLSLEGGEEKTQLTCCSDCSSKFEIEVQSLQNSNTNTQSTTSTLPAWLQQCKDGNKGLGCNNKDSAPDVRELCRKWNSFCNSVHKQPFTSERTPTFSSVSPSSTSCFSYDHQYPTAHHNHREWPPMVEPRQHPWNAETSLRLCIPESKDDHKQPLSSSPNSASSIDFMEMESIRRFKEFNTENLTILCSALEKKVPWQKDIIHEIANTVLKCRSGMVKWKMNARHGESKEETWLFFQGVDVQAKEKIAKELARLVFGSPENLIKIALSSFSSTRADSTEDHNRNKRLRDEHQCSYIERFAEAVSSNPHRVFFMEDVEQADYCSQLGFKRAMERGRIVSGNGEEISLGDAIVILSCESFSSRSRACSPLTKQKLEGIGEERGSSLGDTSPCVTLDLNISIDEDGLEDQSIDDIGLLESVDGGIVFKTQDL
ncbi:hypothetical protein SLEP1_g19036 [Rubroshorea leprosula]|nr:hypothetical protein SLEP1_g19036 [Rubroshorea leprosula]